MGTKQETDEKEEYTGQILSAMRELEVMREAFWRIKGIAAVPPKLEVRIIRARDTMLELQKLLALEYVQESVPFSIDN